VSERRPTNSELKLQRLEEEEPVAEESKGILELFGEPRDEDAPLTREDDADR
jgi:hypothetical protein